MENTFGNDTSSFWQLLKGISVIIDENKRLTVTGIIYDTLLSKLKSPFVFEEFRNATIAWSNVKQIDRKVLFMDGLFGQTRVHVSYGINEYKDSLISPSLNV